MSAKRKRDKVKKAVKRKPKLSIKEKRKLRREKHKEEWIRIKTEDWREKREERRAYGVRHKEWTL